MGKKGLNKILHKSGYSNIQKHMKRCLFQQASENYRSKLWQGTTTHSPQELKLKRLVILSIGKIGSLHTAEESIVIEPLGNLFGRIYCNSVSINPWPSNSTPHTYPLEIYSCMQQKIRIRMYRLICNSPKRETTQMCICWMHKWIVICSCNGINRKNELITTTCDKRMDLTNVMPAKEHR